MAGYHAVLALIFIYVVVCISGLKREDEVAMQRRGGEKEQSFHLLLATQQMLIQTRSFSVPLHRATTYGKSKHNGEKVKKEKRNHKEEHRKKREEEEEQSLHQLLPNQNDDIDKRSNEQIRTEISPFWVPVEEASVREMYRKFKHKGEEEDDDDDEDEDHDDDKDEDEDDDQEDLEKEKEKKKNKKKKEEKNKSKEEKKREKEKEKEKKKSSHNLLCNQKNALDMMPNEKILKESSSSLAMHLEEIDNRKLYISFKHIRENEEEQKNKDKNEDEEEEDNKKEKKKGKEDRKKGEEVKEEKQSQHLALPNMNDESNIRPNEQMFTEIRPVKVPLKEAGLRETYINKDVGDNVMVEKDKEEEQKPSLHLLLVQKDESNTRPQDQMPMETHPLSRPLERANARENYGKFKNKREKKKKEKQEKEKEHDKKKEKEYLQFARKGKWVEFFFNMFHVQTEPLESGPKVEEFWPLP